MGSQLKLNLRTQANMNLTFYPERVQDRIFIVISYSQDISILYLFIEIVWYWVTLSLPSVKLYQCLHHLSLHSLRAQPAPTLPLPIHLWSTKFSCSVERDTVLFELCNKTERNHCMCSNSRPSLFSCGSKMPTRRNFSFQTQIAGLSLSIWTRQVIPTLYSTKVTQ